MAKLADQVCLQTGLERASVVGGGRFRMYTEGGPIIEDMEQSLLDAGVRHGMDLTYEEGAPVVARTWSLMFRLLQGNNTSTVGGGGKMSDEDLNVCAAAAAVFICMG